LGPLADQRGFAVLYPDDYQRNWNNAADARGSRSRAFGTGYVSLLGPEGNELVLLDLQKINSSGLGFLGRLFPRGLMLLDFDEHHASARVVGGFQIRPRCSPI
jgi:hypothetical protein